MDQIISALANNKNIRVMVADVTELVKTAQVRHQLFPTATAALGRTMAIASIMAFQLKNDEEMVSIRIAGDGPLELIRVDAQKNGNTVGFVGNPSVNLINEESHKLDVGAAIGKGQLSVSRNYNLKHEFTSSVDLVSGEIAEDFAFYFTQSEQLPSAVSLGVLVDETGSVLSAGGLLIQMLPGHTETDILMAEHVVKYLKPISQILNEGMTAQELVESLFDEVELVDGQPVQFVCHCSRQQMERALKTLSVEDLVGLQQEEQGVNMECQYCNEHYHFSTDDITEFITEKYHAKN
ncbi:MAG TPA: Hsp33 family molecular chaperone HslO [Erysipelothrix sp.]|jgi:molecular chaperone Hsp33|nr:Hsp33 family molecular chaperone HslO [Erysipelothrix sp.]